MDKPLFTVFRHDLPEEYIFSLNPQDTETLIEEAEIASYQLELELDGLFWRDNPRFDEDGYALYGLMPSDYTYEFSAFEDEIAADPAFKELLVQAQVLQQKIARTEAVLGAALVRKQDIIAANYTPDRQFGDPLDNAKFDFGQMGYKLIEPELREDQW